MKNGQFQEVNIDRMITQSLISGKPSLLKDALPQFAPFTQQFSPIQMKVFGSPKKDTEVLDRVTRILESQDEFLIISNIRQKKSINYYSLLVDREKIHLFEKYDNKETNTYYTFKTQKAKINNQEMSDDFLTELGAKVQKITLDLEQKRADLYEKDE